MKPEDVWRSCKGVRKGSMFLARLKPNGMEGYIPMGSRSRIVRVKRKARHYPTQGLARTAAREWAETHYGARPPDDS